MATLRDVILDFAITRDISIIIGADMPTLHVGQIIRKGKPNEPIVIKTILHSVLIGGKSEIYLNYVNSNKLDLQNQDTLTESVKCSWEFESFCTRPKTVLTLVAKNE